MSEEPVSPPSVDLAPASTSEATTPSNLPRQRWQIFPAQKAQAKQIAQATALSPLLAQVLINRGIYTPEQAWEFLDPEAQQLPSPLDEFPDLALSLDLLAETIEAQQPILICGDYDADGMTSTALLMRSLRHLGAQVSYAIPSRMEEGYGINQRIVEDFHKAGGALILTVDNGIAAYEPIARARALDLKVIITDHHEAPDPLPPADAILNPKLIRETSPYRGVAGVGVAYILAVCLAQQMGQVQDLTATLLGLFTLGTIADLAPLTGVNRRWVKRGLKLLPKSRIPGVQALIEVAGLSEETSLKPEAIGFRLGPRINAVGRIGDPQIVIDLLTTEDIGIAIQRAMQCEETNQLRRQMCDTIEQQAVAWCEEQQEKGLLNLEETRVLVIVQPDWHHGVIGIVASRLVERYGVPVFIGTYEDKARKEIRGSARSIPEFNVFEALEFCDDLLDRYGGHRAAGGFSFPANRLRQVQSRLSTFARRHLQPEHLRPLITVDVRGDLQALGLDLYHQIDRLHPCGIENPDPVFWSANVTVVEQKPIGKHNAHLKLTLAHRSRAEDPPTVLKAIAWRWGEYYPLPRQLDIAYRLRLNEWQGKSSLELELVGVRAPTAGASGDGGIQPWSARATVAATTQPAVTDMGIGGAETADGAWAEPSPTTVPDPPPDESEGMDISLVKEAAMPPADFEIPPSSSAQPPNRLSTNWQPAESGESSSLSLHAEFFHGTRRYKGSLENIGQGRQLTLQNSEGHQIVVQMSDGGAFQRNRQGFLYLPEAAPQPIDLGMPKFMGLVRAGLSALELQQKNQLLIKKDELLTQKDQHIRTLQAQIELLEEEITQLSAEQQRQFASLASELKAQQDTIAGKEAHIEQLQIQASPTPSEDSGDLSQQVRQTLGDDIWYCLQAPSQEDLLAAYKNSHLIHTQLIHTQLIHTQLIHKDPSSDPADESGAIADYSIADYSEAGIRLTLVVEREIIPPFFNGLYDFLLPQGITEIGGLLLERDRKYALGMLPPLLASQWRAYPPAQLSLTHLPAEGIQMKRAKASPQVSKSERDRIDQFLSQWEHPMAICFRDSGPQAASSLAQISQLQSIAVQREHLLYRWQYDLLHQLIAGQHGQGGLLRKIFAL